MESEKNAQTAADNLHELDKAQAKIYTSYSRLAWWEMPITGLSFAVLIAAQAATTSLGIMLATISIVFSVGYSLRSARKRGVFLPSSKNAPPHIKRESIVLVAGFGISMAAVFVIKAFTSWQVAAVATFVILTAHSAITDHRLAKAAQKTERDINMQS